MRTGVVFEKVRPESMAPPASALSALDTQFLERGNRRLALVSGVFAGAVATLVVITLLLYGPLGWEGPDHLRHFLSAQTMLCLLSVATAFVCWRRVFSLRTTMKLGLVYQVATALIISLCAFYGDMLLQPVMLELSWLGVWIVLFPLFVPGPPAWSMVASLLCATTAPTVFLTWSLVHGQALPAIPILAATFVPYYVCAGLAVIPAWLVYDLGTAVSAAREEARQLGGYRLLEPLGQGGMGAVWRAEHSLLARPAAIKLVRPAGADKTGTPSQYSRQEVLERFTREAQATAALTSPHTVSLYDYGVAEDGTFYYAMELLDGLDLEELVQRFGPVSPARTVYLLRQACESLAEAHSAGLVHRDVKPANLVACHVGGRVDFVKILDFGLVRRLKDADEDALISDYDYVVGTPAFMSPEQAIAPEEVDGRADIYALGAVAYWLLTGRLVFEQPTVAGVMADHVHAVPVPPSERTPLPIPPALERLVLDCLAKDPALRPQTADELDASLERIDTGVPWTQEQAHAWWQARLSQLSSEDVKSVPASGHGPSPGTPPSPGAPPKDGRAEEPDSDRLPSVAVGTISEARLRARQRAYAKSRAESRRDR